MVEHKFDNEYNVVLFALSSLLDRFEEEDRLFPAQCIWWLASINQFMEIVLFYQLHNVFTSEFIKNCVVTPSPQRPSTAALVSESNIPELDLSIDSDTLIHPSRKKLSNRYRIDK